MQRAFYWVLALVGMMVSVAPLTGSWTWTGEASSLINANDSGISPQDFSSWLAKHVDSLEWEDRKVDARLTSEILESSLDLGGQFIVNNQKPAGNFNYQYDFVQGVMDKDDNQVRQAGALWGLALIYQYRQDPAIDDALRKGLQFFFKYTRQGPVSGSLFIAYPGASYCKTGTVALVALAIIDYLHGDQTDSDRLNSKDRRNLHRYLEGYLKYLEHMRLDNKRFSEALSLRTRKRSHRSSPYFDGESLLALIKAAKYLDHTYLIPLIEDTAMVLAKLYTMDAWQRDPDSDQTKGFYQWGSMAFWEYQEAGWRDGKTLGDAVLALAWWMIHTHRTLERTRNTAYAYEGMIHAYRLAEDRGLKAAAQDLARTIDSGLYKLTSWQVDGPLDYINPFLVSNSSQDTLAVGGVMNHRAEPLLRIDVTQHQMHAVVLALRYVYTEPALTLRPTSP